MSNSLGQGKFPGCQGRVYLGEEKQKVGLYQRSLWYSQKARNIQATSKSHQKASTDLDRIMQSLL